MLSPAQKAASQKALDAINAKAASGAKLSQLDKNRKADLEDDVAGRPRDRKTTHKGNFFKSLAKNPLSIVAPTLALQKQVGSKIYGAELNNTLWKAGEVGVGFLPGVGSLAKSALSFAQAPSVRSALGVAEVGTLGANSGRPTGFASAADAPAWTQWAQTGLDALDQGLGLADQFQNITGSHPSTGGSVPFAPDVGTLAADQPRINWTPILLIGGGLVLVLMLSRK